MAKITLLLHIYAYSIFESITKVLGVTQVVLLNEFAKTFINLCRNSGLKIENTEDYISLLKDIGIVEECKLNKLSARPEGDLVEFVIESCVLAPTVHKPLNMYGYTGHMCPLAIIGMVALAQERGWKQGKNLFDYVKFLGKLTYFTENGSKTVFQIVRKWI